jgi:putative transposase
MNKYRVESTPLEWYDYYRDGKYFFTICIKNPVPMFGEITGGSHPKVNKLSDFGRMVSECWNDPPNNFPNIILGEFIVMPDHVYGIIIIKKCKN